MRLYLSSFGLGNRPEALKVLLRGKARAAIMLNAKDASSPEGRRASLDRELEALLQLGLEPTELDLRNYFGRDIPSRRRWSDWYSTTSIITSSSGPFGTAR